MIIREPHIQRTPSRIGSLSEPVDAWLIHAALVEGGVGRFYPGFHRWFFGKVVPGLRRGERRILTSLLAGAPVGIAICKRTEFETKLCALWVSSRARHQGIAAELADGAFGWLGTAKPLFTVPEERHLAFSGLLRSWSFSRPTECEGLYRAQRIEYVYNRPPAH